MRGVEKSMKTTMEECFKYVFISVYELIIIFNRISNVAMRNLLIEQIAILVNTN